MCYILNILCPLSFLKRLLAKISRFFNRCFRFLGLIPNIAKNNIDKRDKLKTKETKRRFLDRRTYEQKIYRDEKREIKDKRRRRKTKEIKETDKRQRETNLKRMEIQRDRWSNNACESVIISLCSSVLLSKKSPLSFFVSFVSFRL